MNLLQRVRLRVATVQSPLHLVTALDQQLNQPGIESQARIEIQRNREVIHDCLCHPFSFTTGIDPSHRSRTL